MEIKAKSRGRVENRYYVHCIVNGIEATFKVFCESAESAEQSITEMLCKKDFKIVGTSKNKTWEMYEKPRREANKEYGYITSCNLHCQVANGIIRGGYNKIKAYK